MACHLVAPVFLKYEKELLGFLKKKLKDQNSSEDILNDVLMKVYKNCEKLEKVENSRAWLYQITKNALYDYIKENQRYQSLKNQEEFIQETEDSLYQTMGILVPEMINFLPDNYRIPLELSDIQGLPQQEIANKLGLSLSGAKSRIQRAREKLKALFFECFNLELDSRGIPSSYSIKEHCTPLLDLEPQLVNNIENNQSNTCCERPAQSSSCK